VPCANRIIARFLDDPEKAPDGSCSLEATPTFYTPDQLLDLPARTPGTATLLDHAAALAAPAFVIALALGLLFSAVPVYSVSEIVRVFRSRPLAFPDGWQGRLILAAPWIPVFCAFLLALFLVVASVGIGSKLASNQMLLLVGALPVSIRAIGWWLVPYLAGLVLMTVTMIVLWKHGSRSRLGRLYYTLLVLAGWSVCWAVVRTRLVGL
jgi:hypothetical protein